MAPSMMSPLLLVVVVFLLLGPSMISSVDSFLTTNTATHTNTALFSQILPFEDLRKAFPKDANIVKAGGWHNLEQLSKNNPKDALVKYVVDGLKGTSTGSVQPSVARDGEKIEALALLLYGMGKGFTADAIDGEWDLVFTKQGSKSPSFQKIVGKQETAGRSKNFFDVGKMVFSGDVRFWRWGKVATTVKYTPTSEAFSVAPGGKIVVRRIVCQIINAFFKWWKLPGIPFPLPKTKGFLEVVYLDQDIRVTKGNRGGFFVHFRPGFLKQQVV
eukprot:CAMPEP_0168187236 /NCGR_PEP_ID=MMETSP0139_2-20121125/14916_1 /TAXON_ID=44445 /ORGANISM="Pseudo-nitzschia australis, Strain 10249 10 AB" /LENGTH=271 /DNA_ID=CAMNT_0008109413 /DNA_START=130 /DNA_END=945 /DNA_ORIENTATION=-